MKATSALDFDCFSKPFDKYELYHKMEIDIIFFGKVAIIIQTNKRKKIQIPFFFIAMDLTANIVRIGTHSHWLCRTLHNCWYVCRI